MSFRGVQNHVCVLVLSGICLLSGCGGEDFSAPPANLAEIRAKARAKVENPKSETAATPPAGETSGSEEPPAGSPGKGPSLLAEALDKSAATSGAALETEASDGKSKAAVTKDDVQNNSAANLSAQASQPPPGESTGNAEKSTQGNIAGKDVPSPTNRAAAANVEGETVTAGGKTEAQLKKDQDSENSVVKSGMSLLDKLRMDDEDEKSKIPQGRVRPRHVVERTGRFAIAAETWFRLRNQLAKRFFFAATSDGSKIAASSGERSLGVLSTRVEVLGEELNWARLKQTVAAVRTEKKEVTTQPVTGLPGMISALELIDNGNVVLIGTADGRVLARSSANLQDWDIYARDLFAFQDEHRASTKVSDSAIIVVRALSAGRLLTIDDDGKSLLWDMNVVVHKPVSPMEMTEAQARSPEAPTVTAQPLKTLDLPESRVLSFTVSDSTKYATIVTSDEQVTVFQTDDGRIVGSVSAAELDDTQPVCALLEEDQKRLLIGLADGRIFRRALPGGEAVSGVTDEGVAVDYEPVFTPEISDRSGAVTAMELKADSTVLYIGRLNGQVAQFDLPRKQQLSFQKLHDGPVVEMWATSVGLITIGDDRVAKLSDIPDPATRRPPQTFQLPKDAALKEREVIDRPESLTQDKFTVRRNFDRDVTDTDNQALSLAGIRPSDPVQALYEHQLRVSAGAEERNAVRKKLMTLRGGNDTEQTNRAYSEKTARKVAEIPTEFDFQSRPLRRVVLALSDDAAILAAAQFYKTSLIRGAAPDQPLFAWDTLSGTVLRTWRRSPGVYRLKLDLKRGLILPTPFSARMDLFSGAFRPAEVTALSAARSPLDDWLAVGLTGLTGTASDVLMLVGRDTENRRKGIEAFEGAIPEAAWSADGRSLFASVRERTRTRLLELEVPTLQVRNEIRIDPMEGKWDVAAIDPHTTVLGATQILPSSSGRLLVTYGRYSDPKQPFQLRIWKRTGDNWAEKPEAVVGSAQQMFETDMTDTQMVFVDGQDSQLAVVGPKGVAIVNTRNGTISDTLALPDVGGRRPVTAFSPNGKWLLAGDQEGNIWTWELRSLKRDPQKFLAHAGPVTGIAVAPNSQFVATAGEENRIRVWDTSPILSVPVRAAKR